MEWAHEETRKQKREECPAEPDFDPPFPKLVSKKQRSERPHVLMQSGVANIVR